MLDQVVPFWCVAIIFPKWALVAMIANTYFFMSIFYHQDVKIADRNVFSIYNIDHFILFIAMIGMIIVS